MKRKYPSYHDVESYEKNFLSSESGNIFNQQPSITKFNSSNEDCKKYLYVPKLLKMETFPEILRNVPLFLLDQNISVGITTSKPIMCTLLHGSPLTANNLFGMDIGRFSHISDVEHNNLRICHATEQCVKSLFNAKTEIFISIKSNEVFINDKSYKFIDEGNKEIQKTDKILINNRYSVEFEKETKKTTKISLMLLNNTKNQDLPKPEQTNENDSKGITISIESEIPLIFDNYEERDEESDSSDEPYNFSSDFLRIVSPELVINSSIQSTFCDFLVSSKLIINNKIECKKSFLIRANDLLLDSIIETNELLIVSSTTVFSNVSALETSNLCAIFASISFECESYQMKLSKNTFIKSRRFNFHSKKQISKLEINTINTNENEEEEEEEDEQESIANNCFIQAEKVNIGPNINIKIEENFSIECSSLEISNRKTIIEIGEKLYLLFITNKTGNKNSINNGQIKCSDLFFEVNSEDSSPTSDFIFQTTNKFTVGRSFLLSSGTFENTGNVLFGSFYISAYSKFLNSGENSSFKIGDFLVVESEALFSNEGKIHSVLKPTILNSGKMTFSYHKEKNENKGRGRKKNDNFLSKSSQVKRNDYSFVCEKFVTNGQIEGDYFSAIANDLISIAGKIKCREIDLEANEISFTNLALILTFKATFKSFSVELSKGIIIKAANFLNYCDQKKLNEDEKKDEDLLKLKDKIVDSSVEILYKKDFVGEINDIKCFDKIQKVQITNFRDDVIEDKNKTKANKKK